MASRKTRAEVVSCIIEDLGEGLVGGKVKRMMWLLMRDESDGGNRPFYCSPDERLPEITKDQSIGEESTDKVVGVCMQCFVG